MMMYIIILSNGYFILLYFTSIDNLRCLCTINNIFLIVQSELNQTSWLLNNNKSTYAVGKLLTSTEAEPMSTDKDKLPWDFQGTLIASFYLYYTQDDLII